MIRDRRHAHREVDRPKIHRVNELIVAQGFYRHKIDLLTLTQGHITAALPNSLVGADQNEQR
jgi:hypothetical protein